MKNIGLILWLNSLEAIIPNIQKRQKQGFIPVFAVPNGTLFGEFSELFLNPSHLLLEKLLLFLEHFLLFGIAHLPVFFFPLRHIPFVLSSMAAATFVSKHMFKLKNYCLCIVYYTFSVEFHSKRLLDALLTKVPNDLTNQSLDNLYLKSLSELKIGIKSVTKLKAAALSGPITLANAKVSPIELSMPQIRKS